MPLANIFFIRSQVGNPKPFADFHFCPPFPFTLLCLQEIGKRIQLRRKQLGYTQDQLASMMDVSIQMISNLERGNKAIRIDNLINLSQILNISTDYILTGKNVGYNGASLSEKISLLSSKSRDIIEQFVDYCLNPYDL